MRPSVVQQRAHARGSVRGVQVEIGHAPPEQRMSLPEVVVDVETGDHRGDAMAWLVHAQQLEHGVAESPAALIDAAERDLRHGVAQHPGTDGMPFGVIAVEEALG